SQRSTTRIRFSIVTKAGNINTILIISFLRVREFKHPFHVHDSYHQFLEGKGIQASISRKGNSPDNGMMESFFGILKSEMFYGYEKTFKSLNRLEQAIVDYIDYYNNKRIKVKLKGLSPVQYRTKSFG
ncbi:TPA: IS3 family transposase, partial [Streptococcus pneumoniae]